MKNLVQYAINKVCCYQGKNRTDLNELIIKILAVRNHMNKTKKEDEITELCLEIQKELLRIRSMYQQKYLLNLYHTHDKDRKYFIYCRIGRPLLRRWEAKYANVTIRPYSTSDYRSVPLHTVGNYFKTT